MTTRRSAPEGRKSKAATADILNHAPAPAKIPSKWQKYYERLIELGRTLSERRSEAASDALSELPAFSTHMADAGTDTYDRDFALGILSSEQDAIYEVDEA